MLESPTQLQLLFHNVNENKQETLWGKWQKG